MPPAKLNDVTARALNWLAIIILFTGMMIPSPAGSFFSAMVAMMVALVPLFFSRSKKRIIAGIILLVAAFFAYASFGAYQKDYNKYRERVRPTSSRYHPVHQGSLAVYCIGIAQPPTAQGEV
jgi:cell division protein FtsW (lipid II flippase)